MGQWVEQRWIPADGSGLSRRARQGGTFHAFVPAPLSDHHPTISPGLSRAAAAVEQDLSRLARTDTAEGLEGVARLLMRSEAISSSKIEGIAPGPDKVALAEIAESEDVRGFKHNAELVARNLGMLREIGSDLADAPEITVADICRLQENLIGDPHLAGLRTTQNWIGGSGWTPTGAEFIPPPHDRVPALMTDLVEYLNGATHGALIQAALVHAQFKTIHPFADGNGRVGRALIHAVLQRRGLTHAPILPVSMVLGTWADRYVAGLTAYREDRDAAWIEFFIEATARAMDQAAKISADLSVLKASWRRRINDYRTERGLQRALRSNSAEAQILAGLPAHPLLTTASVERLYKVSSTNAKKALDSLENAGILRSKVVGRNGLKGFYADELFDLVTLAERRLASTRFDTRLSPPLGRAVPGHPG